MNMLFILYILTIVLAKFLIPEMYSMYFDPQIGYIICNFKSINIIHHKTCLLLSTYRVLRRPITMIDGRGIYGTNFSNGVEEGDTINPQLYLKSDFLSL